MQTTPAGCPYPRDAVHMQRTDEFTLPSLWENISPPDTRLVRIVTDLQQYMQGCLHAPLAIDLIRQPYQR
jgi:hypothetical protein